MGQQHSKLHSSCKQQELRFQLCSMSWPLVCNVLHISKVFEHMNHRLRTSFVCSHNVFAPLCSWASGTLPEP